MALWAVTLEKPGREDKQITMEHLAPWLELVVDRLSVSRGWDEWCEIISTDRTIFIETYALTSMNPDTGRAWAQFRSIRRSHVLPRKFNPARLPA